MFSKLFGFEPWIICKLFVGAKGVVYSAVY